MHRRQPFAPLLLLLPFLPGPAPAEDPARALAALEKRIAEEEKSWLEFKKQAATEEERAGLAEAFPRDEFAGELRAVAGSAKGTEVAARAWLGLYRLGVLLDDRALFEEGLNHALDEHVASPEMAGLALDLVYGAPTWSTSLAQAGLRRILAGNPDKGIQAGVMAELSLCLGLDDALGAAGRAEAETLLARIEKEYGDSDFIGMSGKHFAAGARHEIEHLRVGQPAPDFEVTDQDGVRFKLSDYRGRVVLLDFWGFV